MTDEHFKYVSNAQRHKTQTTVQDDSIINERIMIMPTITTTIFL